MNAHEEFVSLETAELLKKAGFDWECASYYQAGYFHPYTTNNASRLVMTDCNNAPDYMEQFSAPTQAVAMRWLREVKGWSATIQHAYDNIHDKWIYQTVITNIQEEDITDSTDLFYGKETYEQASEKGIQECLKIILNGQE